MKIMELSAKLFADNIRAALSQNKALCPDGLHNEYIRLGECINLHLRRRRTGKLDVIPLPTGCGKTTALIEACRMLSPGDNGAAPPKLSENHSVLDSIVFYPGILVVVREVQDADELAAKINKFKTHPVAHAWHSKNKTINPTNAQILIITHSMYTNALLSDRNADHCIYDSVHNFEFGIRTLTFIDEKPSFFKIESVNVTQIRTAIAAVCEPGRYKFKAEIQYLEGILGQLNRISDNPGCPQFQSFSTGVLGKPPCFTQLLGHLKSQPLEHAQIGKNDIAIRALSHVRIPEHPATHSDNIRPPKPEHPATLGTLR
jgi:hypothetical protein